MTDVFISYAQEDREVASRLVASLEANGQSVFYDQNVLVAGEDFSEHVSRALTEAKAVVVLLSRHSQRSRWVEAELRAALEKGSRVIPVLLDEDATNNWVWPLVSDRQAVRVDSAAGIDEITRQVTRAVEDTATLGPSLAPSKSRRTYWLILLVAILSGIAGAILSWLAR